MTKVKLGARTLYGNQLGLVLYFVAYSSLNGECLLVIGQRYSLLILSEVRIVREVLAEALGQRLRFTNISGVSSLAQASVQISVLEPKMVLIDATMSNAIAAARWLHQRDPAIRLIAFNTDEAGHDSTVWTEAGIVGYFDRSVAMKVIVELVGKLSGSELTTDKAAVRRAESDLSTTRGQSAEEVTAAPAVLTPREEEVVKLIIAGESNKGIARSLKISLPTVKSHVHNALAKLGVERRGKLAFWYNSRELIIKPEHTLATIASAGSDGPLGPSFPQKQHGPMEGPPV